MLVAQAEVPAAERQVPRAPKKERKARVTEVALAALLPKVTEERREGKKGAGGKKGDDAFAQGLVTNTRKGDGKAGPGFVQIVHLGSLSRYSNAEVTVDVRSNTCQLLSNQGTRSLDDCGASVTAVNAVAGLLDFEEAGRVRVSLLMQLGRTHSVLAPFE